MFFYLYLIRCPVMVCMQTMKRGDIFSRKIVGWEVHERESADLAAVLTLRRSTAVLAISRR